MRGAWVLLLCAACGERNRTLVVEPPPLDGASAILVGFEDGGRLRSVSAHPLQRSSFVVQIPVPEGLAETEPLVAFLYDASLEDLRLQAGDLDRVEDGETIPEPELAFSRAVEDDGRWSPLQDTEALRTTHPIQTLSQCRSLDLQTSYALETTSNPSAVLRIDDESALVTTFDRHWYVVRPDALERVAPWFDGSPTLGTQRSDGESWIITGRGTVWTGRVSDPGSFVNVGTAPTPGFYEWGSVTSTGAVELYMLSVDGTFIRYDETGFTLIETFPSVERAGVAALGDGEVVVARQRASVIDRFFGDGSRVVESPNDLDGYASARHFPGLGTALGGFNGIGYFRAVGDEWRSVANVGRILHDVIQYDSSILFGGSDGLVGEFIPGLPACPPQRSERDIRRMLRVGDLLFFAHFGPDPLGQQDPTRVGWASFR